jgi:hypothetical protein
MLNLHPPNHSLSLSLTQGKTRNALTHFPSFEMTYLDLPRPWISFSKLSVASTFPEATSTMESLQSRSWQAMTCVCVCVCVFVCVQLFFQQDSPPPTYESTPFVATLHLTCWPLRAKAASTHPTPPPTSSCLMVASFGGPCATAPRQQQQQPTQRTNSAELPGSYQQRALEEGENIRGEKTLCPCTLPRTQW